MLQYNPIKHNFNVLTIKSESNQYFCYNSHLCGAIPNLLRHGRLWGQQFFYKICRMVFYVFFSNKKIHEKKKTRYLGLVILGISIILLMPLVNNTNTVNASFETSSFEGPEAVAFDSANGDIYVANGNGDNVKIGRASCRERV